MATIEGFAEAFFPDEGQRDSTVYGTVASVNQDGSYQVRLNASTTTTRCTKLCDASAGDRVLVLIQANGRCAAVGRVGGDGIAPTVLYDDPTGTAGTVTLGESAANFGYMRIYYKKSGDSNSCASVDVESPDGKVVSLSLINPYDSDHVQLAGRAVQISGTSISPFRKEAYINTTWQVTDTLSIVIYRVEGWSGGASIGFGSTSGGGGGGDGDLHYEHVQSTASNEWEITHNLGKHPSVTVIDSANNEVEGDIVYDSDNRLTLTFSGTFSGTAYLN